MPVSSERKEFKAVKPKYELIRDCLAGSACVKSRKKTYLPQPNPEDNSEENEARYVSYLDRAVFYNVTGRTLRGLTGEVFARDPIVEIPEGLDTLKTDANGEGVDLIQLSKEAVQHTVSYGRCGLYVDFPQRTAPEGGDEKTLPVTKAELDNGDIQAIMNVYHPLDVINWRTVKRGRRTLLSLVVIKEAFTKKDDGFEADVGVQYRVLRLTDAGEYVIELYQESETPSKTFEPTNSKGERLREIPFLFIGSEDNDSQIDEPPLYDMATLNIGHYRNSADYEESSFITGQPTPYFTGLSQNWVDQVLKGQVYLGARASIPLPAGATAGLLQPTPNTLPFAAMEHKEKQMVALGAKLVENRSVQRTAFETGVDQAAEQSTLGAAADNVSDAFVWGLKWCAEFMGVPIDEAKREDQSSAEKDDKNVIEFRLNTEFDMIKLSPEERRQLIEEWVANAISWKEMRENLRRGGVANQDDNAALKDIEDERKKKEEETRSTMEFEAKLRPNPATNTNPNASASA